MRSDGIHIRPARPDDLDAFYRISLATGDAGKDAGPLHRDGRMIGHIYSAPYLVCSPQTAFVAEDGQGVAGYIVGAFDTRAFEELLERDWWPQLRERYAKPLGPADAWNADQRRAFQIHEPSRAPESLVAAYPAHIHMNLLPRLQGRGAGSALLETWLDLARRSGILGVHLGANAQNADGIRFWASRGFERLGPPIVPAETSAVWMGQTL